MKIDEMFDDARERLLKIQRQLGDTADVLRSDWSDGRDLTNAEADKREAMMAEISNALGSVEAALNPKKRKR